MRCMDGVKSYTKTTRINIFGDRKFGRPTYFKSILFLAVFQLTSILNVYVHGIDQKVGQ